MTDMWYAIRTEPGAQMPKREYSVETTALGKNGMPRGKGYRIVPSLNANMSAVERSLADAAIPHYMPIERKVVRSRKRGFTYTTRRFPLIPGYVFVSNITDFKALEDIAGVLEVIRNQGKPYVVPNSDIENVREWEKDAEERSRAMLWKLEQAAKRPTRKTLRERFPKGASVSIVAGPAKGRKASVVGVDRNGRLRAFIDGLSAMVISLPSEHLGGDEVEAT